MLVYQRVKPKLKKKKKQNTQLRRSPRQRFIAAFLPTDRAEVEAPRQPAQKPVGHFLGRAVGGQLFFLPGHPMVCPTV